jgi:hypothetical protein
MNDVMSIGCAVTATVMGFVAMVLLGGGHSMVGSVVLVLFLMLLYAAYWFDDGEYPVLI